MTVTEAEWRELDSPHEVPGRSRLRLHPDSPLDMFLAVSYPARQRMLVLRADARSADSLVQSAARLPQAEGIEMRITAASAYEYELQVILADSALREVFNSLVGDVAATARSACSAADALATAVSRFERWQELLRSLDSEGLRPEARRGLFGELLVLNDQLLASAGPTKAVEAWTGPSGSNHDFQLREVSIETKTSVANRPQSLRIASERQLDDTGTPTLLLALALLDERQGGTGESLNELIDQIRDQISPPVSRMKFDDRLVQAGYLSKHRELYREPRYTLRELRFWRVQGNFPRIVESDLPEGVSDCTYGLNLSGLDDYRATAHDVNTLIEGSYG